MSARKLQIINRPDRSCHDTPSISCCIDPCRLTMVNTPAARVLPPPVLFFSILHARRVRGSQRRCTARRPSRRVLGPGSGLRRMSLHGHWAGRWWRRCRHRRLPSAPRPLCAAASKETRIAACYVGPTAAIAQRRLAQDGRVLNCGLDHLVPLRRLRRDRDQAWRRAPSRSAQAPAACPGGRRPGRAAGITIRERRGAGCRRPAAAGSRASSARRS
jgi:hypothetical protein